MIRRAALSAIAAVMALVVAGCGGSDSSQPTAGGDTTSTSTSTTTSGDSSAPDTATSPSKTVVDGVTLTAQGSRLSVGDTARVSWKPDQKTVGVISVSVTKLQKMPISAFSDWRLNAATQKSTPYFVHATVRNVGRSDLSGRPVPLYLLDQRNTLLQASTFQASYAPCPSHPLPTKFTRGKRTTVCLVYFVPDHGKLVAISFRPTQDFDAITWVGPLAKPKEKH